MVLVLSAAALIRILAIFSRLSPPFCHERTLVFLFDAGLQLYYATHGLLCNSKSPRDECLMHEPSASYNLFLLFYCFNLI